MKSDHLKVFLLKCYREMVDKKMSNVVDKRPDLFLLILFTSAELAILPKIRYISKSLQFMIVMAHMDDGFERVPRWALILRKCKSRLKVNNRLPPYPTYPCQKDYEPEAGT